MKHYILKLIVLVTLISTVMSCMTADELRERAKMMSPNEYVYVKAIAGNVGEIGDITPNELQNLIKEDKITIVDLRSAADFIKESIQGALNFPYDADFNQTALKITNQKPVAIYADIDSIAVKAMHTMQQLGFNSVLNLKEGINAWKKAGNETISLVVEGDKKKLDLINFSKAVSSNIGQVVDVRTLMEYENYHIPGAIVIDYKKDNFADEFKKLDKSVPVLIYCRSGVRSANAIPILEDLGFEVYNLGHGMLDWRKNHMPIQGKNVNAKDAGEEGC